MDIPVLKVEQRTSSGKKARNQIRQQGMIPAVCYGKARETLPLTLDANALVTILKGPRGLNSLIKLDGAENRMVFVQEMQRDPVERNILHVDFISVDETKTITRKVPIVTTGKSAGVKLGGNLSIARRVLEVESLPANIPDKIEIDITELEIGDAIHVEEIKLPDGVTALFETNFTICAVIAPEAEEVVETEEEIEGEEGEGEETPEGEEPAKAESEPEKK